MKRLLFTLWCLLSTTALFAQTTYYHCGTIFNAESGRLETEKTIVVEGNQIVSVDNGYTKVPKGAEAVNLKNFTVLPGFIDLHVHMESESSPSAYLERFTQNPADVAFKSAHYARKTLMAGFTTVRDLGGSGVNISLRNAINSGNVIGPRIFTAGKSIATTGGHADPTNGMARRFQHEAGPADGVINSPEEARQAVRYRYKNGADVIKITATGGVLSVAKDGSGPQFTDAELAEIIRTANEYGMHVAAHAHGPEGMKRAVNAGVLTIEHGTLMTEEVMALMKQKGAYLIPTITAGKYVAQQAEIDGYYPALVVPKAKAIGPKIQDTFGKAYRFGVPIAFGTDAGVFPHGQNGKEFAYMVEAGMPAAVAIQSATTVAAKVLGQETQLGQIAAGFFADFVAVEGDPLRNVQLLENVQVVVKNGELVKGEE